MAKTLKPASRKRSEILDALDIRERLYVIARLGGKTKKEAALEAGYSESMAENALAKIESKEVRLAFQHMARQAVPVEKILVRLSEGLDASRVRPVISGKEVIDTIEEPDYRERREYLVLAAKFGGYYVEKSEVDLNGEINVRTPRERILELLERAASRGAPVLA
jgi:hypothetical protein